VDEGLKKRLIGATVLVSLIVIFVPMLLEDEPVLSTELEENIIPEKSEEEFSSKLLPLETEDLSQPLVEEVEPLVESEAVETAAETEAKETVDKTPEPVVEEKPVAEKKSEPETKVGLSGWVVQVGSFSKRDNAEKLVKELQTKKYAAFTDQVDLSGKILHRVLVGPEVDKKRAEQLMEKLNKYLEPKKLKGRVKRYQ
jgi:DedD protein